MNRTLLLITLLSLIAFSAKSQIGLRQYFDGDDTLSTKSIVIKLDPDTNNIWQIGPPQKVAFDSANTLPNAIVTDTINLYPVNNKSIFTFSVNRNTFTSWGIMALRWSQQLNMEFKKDGGYVEYSVDTGQTWVNVLRDTNAYNIYGFDTVNVDTLPDGTIAFTGYDTTWRDVWVCYGTNFFLNTDSLIFRFTFQSDSVDGFDEGWLIDNMLFHETFFHTVGKVDPQHSFLVYPTITSDIINISTGDIKLKMDNIILTDNHGRIVKQLKGQKQKAVLNVNDLASGNYYLSIQAGEKRETHQVVISK